MKKIIAVILTAAFAVASLNAFAQDKDKAKGDKKGEPKKEAPKDAPKK